VPRFDTHIALIDPEQQSPGAVFAQGPRALGVRGEIKLANRFLKCLFTRKGSDPGDLEHGTDYPNLRYANFTSGSDVRAIILDCVDDAADQLRAIDRRTATLDADERLRDATLLSLTETAPGIFEVWVQLTNVNGVRTPVLVPYARVT